MQPEETYVMVVKPIPMPVTIPVELTVAINELLLLQVPPDGVPESVVVLPVQAILLPDIEPAVLTVTEVYAKQPPCT